MSELLKEQTVAQVAKKVLDTHGDGNQSDQDIMQYFGRSLMWKLCLLANTIDVNREGCWARLREKLTQKRIYYGRLCKTHNGVDELEAPNPETSLDGYTRRTKYTSEVPVSSLSMNSFLQGFEHEKSSARENTKLRKSIDIDTLRLIPLQTSNVINLAVTRIVRRVLYVWCSVNKNIGYHQGLHEVVQTLAYVVVIDAVKFSQACRDNTALAKDMMDKSSIEADTFTLFEALMSELKPAFVESEGHSSGESEPIHVVECHFSEPSTNLTDTKSVWVEERNAASPMDENDIPELQYDVDLNSLCFKIQEVNVAFFNPDLADHLKRTGVEPVLYGLKWIRLLFIRQFRFGQLLLLWDKLFCAVCCRTEKQQKPTESREDQLEVINLLEITEWLSTAVILSLEDKLMSLTGDFCVSALSSFQGETVGVVPLFDKALSLREAMNRCTETSSYEIVSTYDVPPADVSTDLNQLESGITRIVCEENSKDFNQDSSYGESNTRASHGVLSATADSNQTNVRDGRRRLGTESSDPGKVEMVRSFQGCAFIQK